MGIIEGLHPFYDQRVRDLLDFKIYLDISDDVKFAWKIQRDMKERGHSMESIKASIESRKPDFDAYIDPQKKDADVIIEVLPTQLLPGETEGNVLRVASSRRRATSCSTPPTSSTRAPPSPGSPAGASSRAPSPGSSSSTGPTPTTARRSPCWRWTGSSTSWRSSSTWRATSATPPASSTARSPSRCSSTPPSPGPPTARGSSRPSSA